MSDLLLGRMLLNVLSINEGTLLEILTSFPKGNGVAVTQDPGVQQL